MKRILRALAVWMTILSVFACTSAVADLVPVVNADIPEGTGENQESLPEETPALAVWDYDELVVGVTTPLEGAFFTSLWGNTAADLDVRMLLHGYNLVEWNSEIGGFQVDPSVVSGLIVTQNEAGDHVYNIALYPDLTWSDGTPITAWDYAFSWLLTAWPGITQLGGAAVDRDYLLGMNEWRSGQTQHVSGIRVLNDMQLTLTVRHEYLPFFYELGLLDCTPAPISAIAPGTGMADDGEGVYLTGEGLNVERLRGTLMGENGYIVNPRRSSGPYTLTSYEDGTASFALNPYYKGDSSGKKPTIPRIVIRHVNNEEMISLLTAGEVGLLSRCTELNAIAGGVGLAAGGTGFAMSNYTRSGMSFISFACESQGVDSQAVRRAIALCLDKDALVSRLVGNYGLRVDGYYGIGQWMVQLANGMMAYPIDEPDGTAASQQAYDEALAAWQALTLESIPALPFDPAEAARLLEADGWTENEAGGAFRAGTDAVRCKVIGGRRVPLRLTLAYPAENDISEVLTACFAEPLAGAGIVLELREEPFGQLVSGYYGQRERDEDMFYLASNFDVVFDPAPQFLPDGGRNWTKIRDPQLYAYCVNMRRTEPGDTLAYCRKWMEFEQRFAETLPMIPLYSNVYFDFYPTVLHDYRITENITWSQAVVEAYMSDVADEPEEERDDGGLEFEG